MEDALRVVDDFAFASSRMTNTSVAIGGINQKRDVKANRDAMRWFPRVVRGALDAPYYELAPDVVWVSPPFVGRRHNVRAWSGRAGCCLLEEQSCLALAFVNTSCSFGGGGGGGGDGWRPSPQKTVDEINKGPEHTQEGMATFGRASPDGFWESPAGRKYHGVGVRARTKCAGAVATRPGCRTSPPSAWHPGRAVATGPPHVVRRPAALSKVADAGGWDAGSFKTWEISFACGRR